MISSVSHISATKQRFAAAGIAHEWKRLSTPQWYRGEQFLELGALLEVRLHGHDVLARFRPVGGKTEIRKCGWSEQRAIESRFGIAICRLKEFLSDEG